MAKLRVWDRFLTEQDKAHLGIVQRKPVGFGTRPALLLIDNYRGVLGDKPEPLLEQIKTWPSGMGEWGWEGLRNVQRLLNAAPAEPPRAKTSLMTSSSPEGAAVAEVATSGAAARARPVRAARPSPRLRRRSGGVGESGMVVLSIAARKSGRSVVAAQERAA